jgi:hypothetical protein
MAARYCPVMSLAAQGNKLLPVLEAELLTRDQNHSSDTPEASTGRENIWHETFKMEELSSERGGTGGGLI